MSERTLTVSRSTHAAGAVLVAVAGDLDHHTAPELRLVLEEAPFTAGVPVLLELSGLDYCDSTGITVLLSAWTRARGAAVPLSLVGLPEHLLRLFAVVGLDQVLTFHETTEQALAGLTGPTRTDDATGLPGR